MGDPKKQRKKYSTPSHPWQGDRIKSEKVLLREYGLNNKKKLWKMTALLKTIKTQAKSLISQNEEDIKKEKEQFLNRLAKLGIIKSIDIKLEDVLALDVRSILERRLETLLFKKGLAKSMKQANQFIIHGHIFVNNNKVDVPSYLVHVEEEGSIEFRPTSPLSTTDHPERATKKSEKPKPKSELEEDLEEAKEVAEVEEKVAEAVEAVEEEAKIEEIAEKIKEKTEDKKEEQ
ncbi:MAG: 30S ribosomal protein S4 [archaeon]